MTEIRRLSRDDAEIWRDIRLEMLKTAPSAFGAAYDDWRDRPLSDFADWLDAVRIFAALDGARPLATLGWFRMRGGHHAHRVGIVAVYVRAEARGGGLVGRLFQAARADLPADVVQAELEVAADNAAARRAYDRLGFRETGRLPRAVKLGDGFIDRLTMVLPLDA